MGRRGKLGDEADGDGYARITVVNGGRRKWASKPPGD